MAEHKKKTDSVETITLTSKIVQALWCQKMVMEQKNIDFEVYTEFVGNSAKIEIKVKDKNGKTVTKTDGKVFGNYFAGTVTIPKKTKEEVTFTAKLPKHGIEKKSNTAKVIPLVEVKNQKWSQMEAKRGDVLTLTADIENVEEDTAVKIFIFEFDRDGAHDLITKFPTTVKKKKIEVEWEYEYHEDTDEIPTEEELQEYGNHYNPPEYFWMIGIGKERFGNEEAPGLLKFKDWMDINLVDETGMPLADMEYTVTLADGSERTGRLDGNGEFSDEDIPPGRSSVRFHYPDEE
ncbi:MAG: carboxypeptidase-like regulatory domain-containing protein [Proteobacteria bacterium]|nr:carboxypeptidase-like regulatory domain-containing protein [Pseudomonadota bacterium]